MNKKWLIVTPTLGKSPYLYQTIESLRNIPGLCEHIIVCPEIYKAGLMKKYPNSRVIAEDKSKENGMYSAINLGIHSSTIDYDYFCYINDDDCFLPEMKLAKNYLDENLESIYYAKTSMINSKGVEIYRAPFTKSGRLAIELLRVGIIPFMQPSLIIPRKVLNRLGGFNGNFKYCGDLDFLLRAITKNIQFKYMDLLSNAFRVHEGQLSGSKVSMDYEKTQIYKKNDMSLCKFCLRFFILKILFSIFNIKEYLQRFKKTKKLSSDATFYG